MRLPFFQIKQTLNIFIIFSIYHAFCIASNVAPLLKLIFKRLLLQTKQDRPAFKHRNLPVGSTSSLSDVLTVKNLNVKRNNTGCTRIQSYVSELLAFHFKSQTKAFIFSWSHCGTLCVSLYLFRQLAQPLIFQRPQHATDRIMNLSPAKFRRDALCCKYGPCPQADKRSNVQTM